MQIENPIAMPSPPHSCSRRSRIPQHHDAGGVTSADLPRRIRRARSSPARSTGTISPKIRTRSPSASPSHFLCPSPSPEYGSHSTWTAGDKDIKRAYFSACPPPAPLWLAPITAPLPVPLLASLPMAEPTLYISSISSATFDKESVTEEKERRYQEASEETSPQGGNMPVERLQHSRSTEISEPSGLTVTRDVAVQAQQNLKTTAEGENNCCSLMSQEKSREWAGRLRDGHVRLALRALRQLRRADRLHRALLRSPCQAPLIS